LRLTAMRSIALDIGTIGQKQSIGPPRSAGILARPAIKHESRVQNYTFVNIAFLLQKALRLTYFSSTTGKSRRGGFARGKEKPCGNFLSLRPCHCFR